MAILSGDIKLVASQVMDDVPEGGGAATGIAIVDGASNNIFPDTSTDDRAAGRVNFRKVFGVAHTDNTDHLLGASFAVLEPAADPLVHVTLFQTPGWADTRTTAKELAERYLVKGPRMSCRLMDTHYAGSMQLQLYQVNGANFPAGGDAICLRNPDGIEQYVRVLKVTQSSGTFSSNEGGTIVDIRANLALCEIGQPMQFDLVGPPVQKVPNEINFAMVYTTSASSGVAFHGVKPLAAAAAIGDRLVMAEGGIYTPIVPAATIESPLVDIAPLLTRQSLSRTAQAYLTVPAQAFTLNPGAVVRLPTAVQPGSFSMTTSGTSFADDALGNVKQGTTVVGSIDYAGRTVTMLGGAPNYGAVQLSTRYLPATPSGAAVHSDSLAVTLANQGLAFTAVFQPVPAPGTFTLSYMAQGRWYDLMDNGGGKLVGADSSYGSGSINYTTGSVAYTLGAVPDVGSTVIYQWGDSASAVAVAPAALPSRLSAVLPIDSRAKPETLVLTWSNGATNYSATCSTAGVLAGDASGSVGAGSIVFAPSVLPDGDVAVAFNRSPNQSSVATNLGGGDYALALTPVTPGSVALNVNTVPESNFHLGGYINVVDDGAGHLVSTTLGSAGQVVGTLEYATGDLYINPSVQMDVLEDTVQNYASSTGNTLYYQAQLLRPSHTVGLTNVSVSNITHSGGAPVAATSVVTPTWGLQVPVLTGYALKTDALAFDCGNAVYTALSGSLRKGWVFGTGATTDAGTVSTSGAITVSDLPANRINAVTWSNAALDKSSQKVGQGVFRVASAPIKTGVFQLHAGAEVANSNGAGVLSGGGFTGTVDFQRGVVKWSRTSGYASGAMTWSTWETAFPISADQLTYNAVFLQYLPLDGTLLGIETARLPLDGKVPVYRAGGQILVHNTLTTALPNPLTKGTVYDLGRQRIAAVVVRTSLGARVADTLFTVDFNLGTVTFPVGSDLTGLAQPFSVHHRVEDELLVLRADISGKIDLVAGLTHDYPAGTSFVSSKLRKGDLFARAYGYVEQGTWTGVWSDSLIGSAAPVQYNAIDYPLTVTNRGSITERWALVFIGATQVKIIGESIGQIAASVSTGTVIAPINPQTGVPYFSIPILGWGSGWSVGNVLRFNTAAAGGPVWVARTILQGPATVASDSATIAFRADVDA